KVGWFYEAAAGKGGVDALLSARHRRGYTPAGRREKATKDRPTMNPAKTGISRLLIASAIDPDVYRRLLESPEETFDAFDLADPEALPPPPGTVLPGKPLPPLRAVVRVSAIQMQDAAGNPLVGLSASLLQSTNMSAPPPPEAAGNPAALGRDLSAAEVQAAIAAVRCASAGARYGKLIDLLRE